MTTKLTAPTIHLNGTSGSDLMEAYSRAGDALYKAQTALRQTAPHGRDYYVSKDAMATDKAIAEHESRAARIDSIIQELGELYGAIQEQMDARKR